MVGDLRATVESGVRPTFRDPDLERRFSTDGVLTFPALGAEPVARVVDLHRGRSSTDGGFDPDFDAGDRSLVTSTTVLAREILGPVVNDLLVDHRIVFATLIAKHSGDDSGMEAHDDRTYVDERFHRAVTIWIPLVDTDEELDNGALRVVPGSHRLATTPAGSNTPDWYRPYLEPLADGAITFPCKAGHALAYDSRTVHLSPPNRSGQVRLALAAVVVPTGAELVHFEAVDRVVRRMYRVDDGFYLRHAPKDLRQEIPPEAELLAEFGVDEPIVTPSQVAPLLRGHRGPVVPVEPHPDLPDLAVLRRVIGRGPTPIRQLDTVPWLSEVVAGSSTIRREFVRGARDAGRPASLPWIGPPHEAAVDGRWAVLSLEQDRALRWFPGTADLLRGRPGQLEAEFWELGPGTVVGPRVGPAPGILRLLIGLTMPVRPAGIAFARQVVGLPLGTGVLFDEAHPHVLFNEGDEPLPLLTLTVADPKRGPAVRSIAWCYRRLPQVSARARWLREAAVAGAWADS